MGLQLSSPLLLFGRVCAPMKVKVFSWLLALGKLNTHEVLQRRKPFLANSLASASFARRILRLKITHFYIAPLLLLLGLAYLRNLVFFGFGLAHVMRCNSMFLGLLVFLVEGSLERCGYGHLLVIMARKK